ncbi:MAG: sulfatase-like hydrolase/transferase [Pseudomonadota bacterium]
MPRKVLILFTDQWRWDAISALGGTVAKTPNVDRLVARGTVFRNHWTVAVPCGPSRASFLTGLYAMTHRSVINGTPLDDRFDNLALAARRGGVEPLLVGYTTTTPDPRGTDPADPRFQITGDVLPGFKPLAPYHASQDTFRAELKSKGYDVADMDALWRPAPVEIPAGRGLSWPPSQLSEADADNAFYTDQALKHLAVREDRDWLMFLTYMRPHPPFIAPAPWHDMFDPADMPTPRRAATKGAEAAEHPLIAHLLETTDVPGFIPHGTGLIADLSDLDVAQAMATYYGMIAELDHQIGRILDHLDATGQTEETLIVFTSDHGELLGDHHLFGKAGPSRPASGSR